MQKNNDQTRRQPNAPRLSNTLDAVIDALSGLQRMSLEGQADRHRSRLEFMLSATFLADHDKEHGFSTAELLESTADLLPLVHTHKDRTCLVMLRDTLSHLLPSYN